MDGVILIGGTLYGTTAYGGTNNGGTVFSVPAIGGSLSTLASLSPQNLAVPVAGLTAVGGTLYGTTQDGGKNMNYGAVFSLPITGGTPTILVSFNTGNGSVPSSRLTAVGNTLYGTTLAGGATSNYGTVFSIPVTGGTPTTLGTFNNSNGAHPYTADLILVGNNLYGTTNNGGAQGDGTVFSLPKTGGAITTLTSFNGSDGANPDDGLIAIGNTLYGTTSFGGSNNSGTVFSLPITGGTPTILANAASSGGGEPTALTLVGSTFYGSMTGGGSLYGSIFSLPITGGTPTTMATFNGSNGEYPSRLIADASGNLYGTTQGGGGPNNAGTVFELTVPEPATTSLIGLCSLPLLARRKRSRSAHAATTFRNR
jgi:uncharacterized repeat protein (TIGR03803 family)